MIVLLCGCDPGSYQFNKSEYINIIEKIDLVIYQNENYKNVNTNKEKLVFDSSKIKWIETLDSSKIEAFLEEFEEIKFLMINESVNEPTGYCLLWYLKNGNFIVFSSTKISDYEVYSMIAEFDSDNNFIKHHADLDGRSHYLMVVKSYFKSYLAN